MTTRRVNTTRNNSNNSNNIRETFLKLCLPLPCPNCGGLIYKGEDCPDCGEEGKSSND